MLWFCVGQRERLQAGGRPDFTMETLTLKPNVQLVNKGLICPYCGGRTTLSPGRKYTAKDGLVWVCEPCFAWTGVFKGTTVANGRVANKELREARWYVNYYFSPFWTEGHMTKWQAFKWLAGKLRIPQKDCRLGWLDLKQCNKVIEVSRKFLNH